MESKAIEVRFYDDVDDRLLKFAVIAARSDGRWVFCKHKERDTLEIPGGHREPGETIGETAARELREETGAEEFALCPVCVYSVTRRTRVNDTGTESFGMLYWGEIARFDCQMHSEMERVFLLDGLPERWTYPEIQPLLIAEAVRRQNRKGENHAL